MAFFYRKRNRNSFEIFFNAFFHKFFLCTFFSLVVATFAEAHYTDVFQSWKSNFIFTFDVISKIFLELFIFFAGFYLISEQEVLMSKNICYLKFRDESLWCLRKLSLTDNWDTGFIFAVTSVCFSNIFKIFLCIIKLSLRLNDDYNFVFNHWLIYFHNSSIRETFQIVEK